MQLYDLIEFRFDWKRQCFVKVETHKTNVPKSIAYAEKKKREFLYPKSGTVRFKVAKNGEYQYKNRF